LPCDQYCECFHVVARTFYGFENIKLLEISESYGDFWGVFVIVEERHLRA